MNELLDKLICLNDDADEANLNKQLIDWLARMGCFYIYPQGLNDLNYSLEIMKGEIKNIIEYLDANEAGIPFLISTTELPLRPENNNDDD